MIKHLSVVQLLTALLVAGLSATAKAETEVWACHGQAHSLLRGTSYQGKAIVLDAEVKEDRIKSFQVMVNREKLVIKLRGDLSYDLDNSGNNYRSLHFHEDGAGWDARTRTSNLYFKDESLIQTTIRNATHSIVVFSECDRF